MIVTSYVLSYKYFYNRSYGLRTRHVVVVFDGRTPRHMVGVPVGEVTHYGIFRLTKNRRMKIR
jgi:hypothetical protein